MYSTANGNPCDVAPGSEVERHHLPVWFLDRLTETFGESDLDGCGVNLLHYHAYRECKMDWSWIDHYGSTLVDGVAVFVCEPYYRLTTDFSAFEQFARRLRCTLVVSDESHWYPGKTIRLSFVPDDADCLKNPRTVWSGGDTKELIE